MKCPLCKSDSSVLDTRGARRRRECFNGHRFTTEEVAVKADMGALKPGQHATPIDSSPKPDALELAYQLVKLLSESAIEKPES